jgi:hypothetical protein
LASSNEIAPVEKALNGDAVFIMSDRWREVVQEAKMGDNVDVKKSKQGQNTTYFDPNRF